MRAAAIWYMFLVFIPVLLFTMYHLIRWNMAALRWHSQRSSAHGHGFLGNFIFNSFFRLFSTVRAIRQDDPQADRYFRRSGQWMIAAMIVQALGVLFLLIAYHQQQ